MEMFQGKAEFCNQRARGESNKKNVAAFLIAAKVEIDVLVKAGAHLEQRAN